MTASTLGLARDAAERAEHCGSPWVEFKWGGIRAIGVWDSARLRLSERSGADVTARYLS